MVSCDGLTPYGDAKNIIKMMANDIGYYINVVEKEMIELTPILKEILLWV
jgi:hypothetical protein